MPFLCFFATFKTSLALRSFLSIKDLIISNLSFALSKSFSLKSTNVFLFSFIFFGSIISSWTLTIFSLNGETSLFSKTSLKEG